LQDLQSEIGDRFGALPSAANNLLQTARLALRCRELGVRRMDVGTQSSYLQFDEDNRVDSARVISLIQREPRVFRLEGSLKLRVSRGAPPEGRVVLAGELLSRLGGPRASDAREQ
jgi:transcription-repair coupling factor (superfamily II helicase)